MLNPLIWKDIWDVIHQIPWIFKNEVLSLRESAEILEWIALFSRILPCEECSNSAESFIKSLMNNTETRCWQILPKLLNKKQGEKTEINTEEENIIGMLLKQEEQMNLMKKNEIQEDENVKENKIYKKNKNSIIILTRYSLNKFFWNLHNLVNKKLGKPVFGESELSALTDRPYWRQHLFHFCFCLSTNLEIDIDKGKDIGSSYREVLSRWILLTLNIFTSHDMLFKQIIDKIVMREEMQYQQSLSEWLHFPILSSYFFYHCLHQSFEILSPSYQKNVDHFLVVSSSTNNNSQSNCTLLGQFVYTGMTFFEYSQFVKAFQSRMGDCSSDPLLESSSKETIFYGTFKQGCQ